MVFPTASFLFPTFLSKQTELKKISPKGAKNAKYFFCFPLRALQLYVRKTKFRNILSQKAQIPDFKLLILESR